MQTRLNVSLDHTTELQQDRTLCLGHDVEAVPGNDSQYHANNEGDQRFVTHQRVSLVRTSPRC